MEKLKFIKKGALLNIQVSSEYFNNAYNLLIELTKNNPELKDVILQKIEAKQKLDKEESIILVLTSLCKTIWEEAEKTNQIEEKDADEFLQNYL